MARKQKASSFGSRKSKKREPSSGNPEQDQQRPTESISDPSLPVSLIVCVLLSGMAGLIYEVLWSRQLTLFLGTTAYAHAAVLSAFLSGLAAGSYVIGRLSDRAADPFRWYGVMELAIGAYALLMAGVLLVLKYTFYYLVPFTGIAGFLSDSIRFAFALIAMLIPTFLMGGTLPILVHGMTQKVENLGNRTAKLYGLNTVGAAAGAFLAGYGLIPSLGLAKSTLIAAAMNIGVGVWALLASQKWQDKLKQEHSVKQLNPEVTDDDSISRRSLNIILCGFALSGFAALLYQVAWIKALILVIGSSLYAFSATLSVFLAGIAIGSFIAIKLVRNRNIQSLIGVAIVLQLVLAATGIASHFVLGKFPELTVAAYISGWVIGFSTFQVLQFVLCFVAMIIPTLALGILFPVITRVCADQNKFGFSVGRVYGFNTVGTILGALAGGLLILPKLGIENTLFAASALNLLIAVGFVFIGHNPKRLTNRIALSAGAVAILLITLNLIPRWDPLLMQSGPQIQGKVLSINNSNENFLKYLQENYTVDFYREGVNGVYSVRTSKTDSSITINGKVEASRRSGMTTFVLLGQLPMLLNADPRDALVIGMGTGATANAVLSHDRVESLDLIEISPEVVEASDLFRDVNNNVLDDPRLNLVSTDGRNFLANTRKTYDAIISQPSNIWVSGVANLFTREFFQAAKARLNPGGMMAQWIQLYGMSQDGLRSLLATIQDQFDFVTLWLSTGSEMVVLSSDEEIKLDYQQILNRMSEENVSKNLDQINVKRPRTILNKNLLASSQLEKAVRFARINSDSHPFAEFEAAKSIGLHTTPKNLSMLFSEQPVLDVELAVDNMVEESDQVARIPSAGLKIHSPTGSDQNEFVDTRWIVKMVLNDKSAAVNFENRIFVDWKNKTGLYQLYSTAYLDKPSDNESQQLISEFFQNRMIDGGDIQIEGGLNSFWAMGDPHQPGQSYLALSWTCVQDDGLRFQYLANRPLSEREKENYQSTLDGFTSQLSCI